jgi:hypothetical protein
MFNPMTVPLTTPAPGASTSQTSPASSTLSPPPVPPAMAFKPEKPNKNIWDVSIVRRAQGIYPAEAKAKENQMANAKMPTPTGSWGSPG